MPKSTFFNLPEQKKQRIIDTVYDIFINEEYENINIRSIIQKTGISIGSFYKYFYDKDDLYLYLLHTVEKKIFAEEKKRKGTNLLTRTVVPLEEICTEKEIEFDRTWYRVPIEVMRKFYFGEYSKDLNSYIMGELIELKAAGRLKDNVDIDFIFHLYVTSMFNILIYFKDKSITDENEKLEYKINYYNDFLFNGILKPY